MRTCSLNCEEPVSSNSHVGREAKPAPDSPEGGSPTGRRGAEFVDDARRQLILQFMLSVKRRLPAIWAALLLFGCDMCGNDIQLTVVSPDRKLKAVVFERSCGATTGFSTQVSVLPADRDLP